MDGRWERSCRSRISYRNQNVAERGSVTRSKFACGRVPDRRGDICDCDAAAAHRAAADRGSVTRSSFPDAVVFGKSMRLENPFVLRLTEPRSGARVCDLLQLRQAGRAWKIQNDEGRKGAAAHRAALRNSCAECEGLTGCSAMLHPVVFSRLTSARITSTHRSAPRSGNHSAALRRDARPQSRARAGSRASRSMQR